MSDLRAQIALLKACLDKQPKDAMSRPMHEALIGCFMAIADIQQPLVPLHTMRREGDVDLRIPLTPPILELEKPDPPKATGWRGRLNG